MRRAVSIVDGWNRDLGLTWALVAVPIILVISHYIFAATSLSGIDGQRVLIVLVFCSALVRLFFKLSFHIERFWVIGVAGILLILLGNEYSAYIKQISYFVLLLSLIPVFVISSRYLTGELLVGLHIVISVVGAFLVLGCGYVFASLGISFVWAECFAFISHPRFFNHVQLASVFFLAYGSVHYLFSKYLRIAASTALVLLFFVAFVSAGRGLWLSVLIGLVALFVLSRGLGFRIFTVLVLAAIAGFGMSELFGVAMSDSGGVVGLSARGDLMVDNRSRLWVLAWEGVKQSPLFGHGAYSYATANFLPDWLPAHPHQHFLQVAFEYGLLIVVLGYGLFGWLIMSFARQVRASQNGFDLVLLVSLIVIACNAQYSAVLTMPLGQWFFVAYTGLMIARSDWFIAWVGSYATSPSGTGTFWMKWGRILFLGFAFYAAIYWCYIVADYITAESKGDLDLNVLHERHNLMPRTWQNGH